MGTVEIAEEIGEKQPGPHRVKSVEITNRVEKVIGSARGVPVVHEKVVPVTVIRQDLSGMELKYLPEKLIESVRFVPLTLPHYQPPRPLHTTLHYNTTLHKHDTTQRNATLHDTTLHNTTLHDTTLLHYTTLSYPTLHHAALHCTTLHYTYFTTLLHYSTLQ